MAGWAAAGSIGGGVMNLMGQHSANKANIKLNRENRDWMERMSNTEYSRSIGDMLNAGLNPMLSALNGGASTPSNTAPTVQSETEGLGRGVQSAGAAMAQRAAIEQQRANVELTRANTYKAVQEGNSAKSFADNAGSRYNYEMNEVKSRVEQLRTQHKLTDAQTKQILDMLPALKAASESQAKANEQAANSGKAKQRLDELAVPEAEATAKWFESEIGSSGAGKGVELFKQILQILRGK